MSNGQKTFINILPPPEEMVNATQQPTAIRLAQPPPDWKPEGVGALEAAKRGFEMSSLGLALKGEMPEQWAPTSGIERIAAGAGTMLGDLPAGLFGGLTGALAGPGTAMAGAFAMPELIRSTLIEGYNANEIHDVDDFLQAVKRVGWNTTKAAIIGRLTGGAGKYFGKFGVAPRLIGETAVMTGTSSALELHVPTATDFLDNAILVFGFEGAMKGTKYLREMYKRTGRTPEDVASELRNNPERLREVQDEINSRFSGRKVTVPTAEQKAAESFGLTYEQLATKEGIVGLPKESEPKVARSLEAPTGGEGEARTPTPPVGEVTIPRFKDPNDLSMWFLRQPEEVQSRLAPEYEKMYAELTGTANPMEERIKLQEVQAEENRMFLLDQGYNPDKIAHMTQAEIDAAVEGFKEPAIKVEPARKAEPTVEDTQQNITGFTVDKNGKLEWVKADAPEKQSASFNEYMTGISEALTKDVGDKKLGITYQPLRHIEEFMNTHKLKLSDTEKQRLMDIIRQAGKRKVDQRRLLDVLQKELFNYAGKDLTSVVEQPVRTIETPAIREGERRGILPVIEQGIDTIKSHGLKWIESTPFVLRKNPQAHKWSRKIIDANLKTDFEMGRDRLYFEDVFKDLSENQLRDFNTSYDKFVKLLAEGKKTPEQLATDRQRAAELAAADPVYEAALKVASYYNEVRDAYIDSRLEIFKMKRGLEGEAALEVAAMHDRTGKPEVEMYAINEGGNLVENPAYIAIADKYLMSFNRLGKVVKEYYDIVNWGLEAYRTRIERGMFKIVLSRGEGKPERVLGFEQTRLDAIERANELNESGKLKGESITIQRVPWRRPDPTKPGRRSLRGMEALEALQTYSYIMRKKIHYDPLQFAMRREFRNDSKSVIYSDQIREVLYDQVADAKGTYSFGDKVVDGMLYWMQEKSPFKGMFNVKPGLYGSTMRGGRRFMADIKLGYRPMNGALNLFWGIRNIYVKNGLSFVKQGLDLIKTEQGKKLIKNNEWALGMDLAQTEAGSTTALKWWEPVYWFSKPEPLIRKLSLTTNYLYAKEKLGLSEGAAQAYARDGVRTQAWLYNNAALPKAFRGTTRKALLQFKSALTHQHEFIRSLTPQQIVRFVATEAMIGGPRGFLLFVKSLPILAAFGVLDDIEEWLFKRKISESVPVIGGKPYTLGVPGMFGVDVSQAATMQFLANNLEDNFGPLISTTITAYKNTIGQVSKGVDFVNVDPLIRTAPFLNNFMQFYESLDPDNEGYVYSDYGRKYKIGGWYDRTLLLIGASPLERTKQSVILRILKNEEDILNRNKREVYDRFVRLKKDEPVPQKLIDAALEYGITSQGLHRRILLYNLDPQIRELVKADMRRKLRVQGLYEDIE